ncbi:MAG: type II secretion system minor pseudopilin GspH [Gammaproteobacteria bacterium]|nr:type II secretion system minor pseudopilin GspH [Gammaproteobacteria bacterium]
MPTWATGSSTDRRPPARGFSLLELLVVVLLIGIILTMATLAVGPALGRHDGAEEARRLAALLQLAREQAVLRGVEHGLEVTRDGYRLLALGERRWEPLEGSPWRPRTLPEGMRLHLVVDGAALPLPASPPGEPQLLLLSSGEMSPFEIELEGPEQRCLLRGDGLEDLPPPECRTP